MYSWQKIKNENVFLASLSQKSKFIQKTKNNEDAASKIGRSKVYSVFNSNIKKLHLIFRLGRSSMHQIVTLKTGNKLVIQAERFKNFVKKFIEFDKKSPLLQSFFFAFQNKKAERIFKSLKKKHLCNTRGKVDIKKKKKIENKHAIS